MQEALRRAGKTAPSSTTAPTTTTPGSTTTPSSQPGSQPVGNGLFRFGTNARVANKGFAVQAGSFNQWANVKSIATNLEAKFKQPTNVHVVGSGSTAVMFRLLVGQFSTLADANKLLQTMKAGGVAGFVKDLSSLA